MGDKIQSPCSMQILYLFQSSTEAKLRLQQSELAKLGQYKLQPL